MYNLSLGFSLLGPLTPVLSVYQSAVGPPDGDCFLGGGYSSKFGGNSFCSVTQFDFYLWLANGCSVPNIPSTRGLAGSGSVSCTLAAVPGRIAQRLMRSLCAVALFCF